MKFDCIIMNPPYGSNKQKTSNTLHYDITLNCIRNLKTNGKCVVLMPTTVIKNNTKTYKNIKSNYDLYLENIIEFDGNTLFDTSMQDIGIYTFNNGKTSNKIIIQKKNSDHNEIIDSLLNFNYFANKHELSILNKINNGCDSIIKSRGFTVFGHGEDKTNLKELVNLYLNSKKIKPYDFFIFVNYINGALDATWQTTKLKTYNIVDKYQLSNILMTDTKAKTILCFKKHELQSAKNILKLLNTNCLKFGLSKLQYSQTLTSNVYFAFPDIDYSNIDTEEKFYTFFNITPKEQMIIEETMLKYDFK